MTAPSDKLNCLNTAARHGDAIVARLRIGAPAAALRAYVAEHTDLALEESAARLTIRFGDHVHWIVTRDPDDTVRGWFSSGYGDLIAALGIDFSGAPIAPGSDGRS
jgi:hypothetical protein